MLKEHYIITKNNAVMGVFPGNLTMEELKRDFTKKYGKDYELFFFNPFNGKRKRIVFPHTCHCKIPCVVCKCKAV